MAREYGKNLYKNKDKSSGIISNSELLQDGVKTSGGSIKHNNKKLVVRKGWIKQVLCSLQSPDCIYNVLAKFQVEIIGLFG